MGVSDHKVTSKHCKKGLSLRIFHNPNGPLIHIKSSHFKQSIGLSDVACIQDSYALVQRSPSYTLAQCRGSLSLEAAIVLPILVIAIFQMLSYFLISHTNHSDNAAVTVVYALFKESRNENFTLQSVMNLLEELDQTEEEKAVPDVVDADDGVQPREEETDHVANSSDGQARKKEKGKMILLTMLCLAGLFFLSGYIYLYQDGSAGLKDYMMGVCVLSVPALGWFHYHERFH